MILKLVLSDNYRNTNNVASPHKSQLLNYNSKHVYRNLNLTDKSYILKAVNIVVITTCSSE